MRRPCEDLVGELAPQHQIVGDTLARRLLGQRVERLDAGGGEGEQIVVVAAVDGERVTVPRAGAAIAATASSTATSHGSPVPSATGGDGVGKLSGTRAESSGAPR